MPRPKKPTSPLSDPLFAAIFARLPVTDKPWDTDKQMSWITMMAHGLREVYGGDLPERLVCKCHEAEIAEGAPMPSAKDLARAVLETLRKADESQPFASPAPQKFQRNGAANGAASVPEAAKPMPHPFYIDAEGYARNKKGERVNPDQVTDVITDTRGEEGMDQGVIWANESQGWPADRSFDVTLG